MTEKYLPPGEWGSTPTPSEPTERCLAVQRAEMSRPETATAVAGARTCPTPPQGLASGGQALWDAITEAHDLDAAQLVTLWEACRAKDLLDALDDLVRGRRSDNRLRVFVDRPAATLRGTDEVDDVVMAHADAAAVIDLVRRRTGLGPHPGLGNAGAG